MILFYFIFHLVVSSFTSCHMIFLFLYFIYRREYSFFISVSYYWWHLINVLLFSLLSFNCTYLACSYLTPIRVYGWLFICLLFANYIIFNLGLIRTSRGEDFTLHLYNNLMGKLSWARRKSNEPNNFTHLIKTMKHEHSLD